MIVSISQPTLFPWLGYFNMIKNSDVFVFLDNVKFEKHSWQMRNRIKEISKSAENAIWVRIPTKLEKTNTMIKDVIIDNDQKWQEKHIKAYRINYGKNFDEIKFLNQLYNKKWEKLADFNIESIDQCCNYLKIKTKLIRASNLSATGKKGQLVLNICKELKATQYIAATGSRTYLENDKKSFKNENISIDYLDYQHPVYRQKGKQFISNLSILDLLFNEKSNSKNFRTVQ